jgi:hypothetical protein
VDQGLMLYFSCCSQHCAICVLTLQLGV